MPMNAELTPEQKVAILADYAQWSGGFAPDETSIEERKRYAKHRADSSIPKPSLLKFLFEDQDR
jgi:hypothetical protein